MIECSRSTSCSGRCSPRCSSASPPRWSASSSCSAGCRSSATAWATSPSPASPSACSPAGPGARRPRRRGRSPRVVIELVRARGRTSGDVALAVMFYGGIAARRRPHRKVARGHAGQPERLPLRRDPHDHDRATCGLRACWPWSCSPTTVGAAPAALRRRQRRGVRPRRRHAGARAQPRARGAHRGDRRRLDAGRRPAADQRADDRAERGGPAARPQLPAALWWAVARRGRLPASAASPCPTTPTPRRAARSCCWRSAVFLVVERRRGRHGPAANRPRTTAPSGTTTSTGRSAATRPCRTATTSTTCTTGTGTPPHEGALRRARPSTRRSDDPMTEQLPEADRRARPASARRSRRPAGSRRSSSPPRSSTPGSRARATRRPRHRLPDPAGDGRRRRGRRAAHRRRRGGLPLAARTHHHHHLVCRSCGLDGRGRRAPPSSAGPSAVAADARLRRRRSTRSRSSAPARTARCDRADRRVSGLGGASVGASTAPP